MPQTVMPETTTTTHADDNGTTGTTHANAAATAATAAKRPASRPPVSDDKRPAGAGRARGDATGFSPARRRPR